MFSTHGTLLKLVVNAALFMGLCGAIVVILELRQDHQVSLLNLSLPYLILLIVGQVFTLWISVNCWRLTLGLTSGLHVSITSAFVHVAFVLVGKYLPGKVWGLIGRHYLMQRMGGENIQLVRAAVIEQYLLVYTGVAIGGVTLGVALFSSFWLRIVLLLLMIVMLSSFVFNALVHWLSVIVYRVPFLKEKISHAGNLTLSTGDYYRLLTMYGLLWIAIGSIVWVLAQAIGLGEIAFRDGVAIGGAFVLAVNAGFLFLITPGGIGVREGVFISLVAPLLGGEAAVLIAVAHRLLMTFYDVVVGIIGFAVYQVSDKASIHER